MAHIETDLNDYVESLYRTKNFEQAFVVFETYALKFGLSGVFYIYVPRFPMDSGSASKPALHVSQHLSPACISHLLDTGFGQPDPSFNSSLNDAMDAMEWQIKNCEDCGRTTNRIAASESKHGNAASGIAMRLMSSEKGVAMAGFVRCHSGLDGALNTLNNKIVDKLVLSAKLFHSMVISNLCHIGHVLRPVLSVLNDTERCFLQKLAQGKSLTQISHELGKSEKYLDRVMLRIRQKLSGVSADEPPKINRNQVLYYAGLLNFFD
ncbi:hypothetical protein SAMN05421690_100737 [Nitrosomonas sp. Nm51]|uniref:hypothetical protein n=1 Tax=Nitrosomonas sp. Nm51 TaxID=133720 RepID=UPI0008BD39A1|nr:hypothetical protein [Nitrosomonas sp. Nm51]SER06531.1 hypothetical protein SAMN05421690_100737 [Nitrosomonas sp. Nm51]